MVERFLLYIKHNIKFLWTIIESGNGMLFALFFRSRINKISEIVLQHSAGTPYSYRKILTSDLEALHKLLCRQSRDDLEFFNPHGFDMAALEVQIKKPAFLMFGVFFKEEIAGYFFLRCFINRNCFVGRIIDEGYRGFGIGRMMNSIMYEISWKMGFRCLSTISKKNRSVMRSHSNNPNMIILKELAGDYLLVEFIRKENQSPENTEIAVNQNRTRLNAHD